MKIPTKKIIDKGLKSIVSADFSSFSVLEIHDYILKQLELLPYKNQIFDTEKTPFTLNISRARRAEDIDGILDNTLPRTFSYPPADVAPLGRLNIENNPVFYGSDSFLSSVRELKKMSPSDEYYVGIWELDIVGQFAISLLLDNNLPKVNPWELIAKNANKNFIELINKENRRINKRELNSKEEENINYLFEAFGHLLNSKNLLATSAIGHKMFYSKENRDPRIFAPIVVYPGVETDQEHCNMAIYPLFVDKFMKLKTVYKLSHKVLEDSVDFRGVILLKGTIDETEKIVWKKPSLNINDSIDVIGIVTPDNVRHFNKEDNEFKFYINNKEVSIVDIVKSKTTKKELIDGLDRMIQKNKDAFYLFKEGDERDDIILGSTHDDGLFLNKKIPVRQVLFSIKYNIVYE